MAGSGDDEGGGLLLGLGITEIIVFLFIVLCIYFALRYSKALRTSLIGAIGGYKDKEKGILDENSRMYRFAKAIGIIPPPPPQSTTQNRGPVEDQKAEEDANKVYAAHREANDLARKLEGITGKKPNCSYAINNDTGAANLNFYPGGAPGGGGSESSVESVNCETVKKMLKTKFAKTVARGAFQLFAENHNGGKEESQQAQSRSPLYGPSRRGGY